jgi:hypothetical protein
MKRVIVNIISLELRDVEILDHIIWNVKKKQYYSYNSLFYRANFNKSKILLINKK